MKQTETMRMLLSEIRGGRWQVGDRIFPERRIAKELSVSRVTVRLALRGLIRQGVIEQRRGSGTYLLRKPEDIVVNDVMAAARPRAGGPGAGGRAFRGKRIVTQRLYRFAFFHDQSATDLVTLANMGGIMDYTKRRGHELVIGAARLPGTPWQHSDFSREVYHPNADGIILSSILFPQDLLGLKKIPVPMVFLSSAGLPAKLPNSVSFDFAGACHQAVEALARAGHRRIAVLEKRFGEITPRLAHECDYLRQELKLDMLLHLFGDDPLAQMPGGPDAVHALYVSDDVYCVEMCHQLAARGLRIGRDITLISLANRGIERGLPRAVGRMEFDTPGIGRMAAHTLEYLLDEGPIQLPPISLGACYVPAHGVSAGK